jgi:hypothetical protein
MGSRRRRGTVAQIALTLFVGVPMTLGLMLAVATYCVFEYVRYAIFPKPEVLRLPPPDPEGSFSVSLAKFAEIHASMPTVNLPQLEDVEAPRTASPVYVATHIGE